MPSGPDSPPRGLGRIFLAGGGNCRSRSANFLKPCDNFPNGCANFLKPSANFPRGCGNLFNG